MRACGAALLLWRVGEYYGMGGRGGGVIAQKSCHHKLSRFCQSNVRDFKPSAFSSGTNSLLSAAEDVGKSGIETELLGLKIDQPND